MDKKTFEGNKLIMESPFVSDHHKKWIEKLIKFEGKADVAFENAKYHSSWDWLLPAVKKFKEYLNNLERPSKNHCCQGDLLEVDVMCALQEVNIEKCFKALLLCIKWYNSQKEGGK